MLQALRRGTKSWVMRALLAGLALTFVLFFGQVGGGGGRHGGSVSNVLIEVGPARIGPQQVTRAFNQEIQAVSALFGGQLDTQQARQIGLLDRAVRRLITDEIYVLEAEDLGAAVSDEQVRQAIISTPQFQNNGNFDAAFFSAFLARAGQSEDQFVQRVRYDLLRQQLLGAVVAGGAAPFTLAETVYRYREEERTAEAVVVSFNGFTDIETPSGSQLAVYFETVRDAYRAPEYRAVTVASLSQAQYAADVVVDETDIVAAYESRLSEFYDPEQRVLRQGVFLDETSARGAFDRISGGESFDAVVRESQGFDPVELGQVVREDLPAEVAEAAFSVASGEISEPVQSPLGWHLVEVNEVIEGGQATLAEVRDRLESELALQLARDDIFEVIEAVEDALAGGATFDEAASENGLVITRIDSVSRGGLDQSGTPVRALPAPAQAVPEIFAQAPGAEGDIIETDDGGFFMLRVDNVIESRPQTMDEVREEVIAGWIGEERRSLAEERADAIAEAVRGGETVFQAAALYGLVASTTQPFTRIGGDGADVPPPLIEPLFESAVNEVSVAQAADGFAVGRLLTIEAPTGSLGLIQVRDDLSNGFIGDLQAQLAAALEGRFDVEIDQDGLDVLF